jgi:hypothetical protein
MSSIGGDSEEKIVVDAEELDTMASACSTPTARSDDPVIVRAKGTREQLPLTRRRSRERIAVLTAEPSPPSPRPPIPPPLVVAPPSLDTAPPVLACPPSPPRTRDPVDVLRMWPHSIGVPIDPSSPPRARLRAPSAGRPLEDKVALAHLALDLYRELEDVQRLVHGTLPAVRGASAHCDAQCQARTDALRGALVEACLLVQRAVLLTPSETLAKDEVDDRVRDLLSLVDH